MNRAFAAGCAVGALALILILVAVSATPPAVAQVGQAAQPTTAPPAPTTPTPKPATKPGRNPRGAWTKPGGLLSATASVTGLTISQVLGELTAGKSLTQVAQDHGKTANDVVQAARALYQGSLNQAVSGGTLTQKRADAILARFGQDAPQVVADAALGQQLQRRARHRFAGELVRAAATATGQTKRQVVTALRGGVSLAQIAQDGNKTADDVVREARARLESRLNQSVADGRITRERADTTLAEFDQFAPQVVADATLGQSVRLRRGWLL